MMFRLLCSLGKPLFKQLESGGGGGGGGGGGQNQQGKKEKVYLTLCQLPLEPCFLPLLSVQGKSVQVLCLEAFSQLLQVVDSRYPTKMVVFLSRLHPGSREASETEERIHFFIKHFQVHISRFSLSLLHRFPPFLFFYFLSKFSPVSCVGNCEWSTDRSQQRLDHERGSDDGLHHHLSLQPPLLLLTSGPSLYYTNLLPLSTVEMMVL